MSHWIQVRVSREAVHHTQYVDQIEIDRDSDGAVVSIWVESPIEVLELGTNER